MAGHLAASKPFASCVWWIPSGPSEGRWRHPPPSWSQSELPYCWWGFVNGLKPKWGLVYFSLCYFYLSHHKDHGRVISGLYLLCKLFVSLFSLCINTTTFLTKLDRPQLVRHMELFSESSCFQSSPNPMSPIEADRFHLIPLEPVDEVGCFSLLFPGEEIHTWLGSSSAAHNDEISLVAMSVEFIKSNIDPLVPSGLKYQDEKGL